MNAYWTFDVRVRAAARAATPTDKLLLLAEDLAVTVLPPGRFPKQNLTAEEWRAFLAEKLLIGGLGRRMRLTRALLFLGAGSDPEAPGVFFLPVAARRARTTPRYAALHVGVHRKKRRLLRRRLPPLTIPDRHRAAKESSRRRTRRYEVRGETARAPAEPAGGLPAVTILTEVLGQGGPGPTTSTDGCYRSGRCPAFGSWPSACS